MELIKKSAKELEKISNELRIDIIKMLCEAGSGHPGGSLSVIDILVVLYFNHLIHDPKNPNWDGRDRVILSKGHVCPALYAVLSKCGYFPHEELFTLRKLGSRLQGHPAKDKGLPGIEVSTGSLGQGLSVGVGMALGFKLDKKPNRVYVIMGDGEQQEGSIWEAVMSAGHYKLDNLIGIVDHNNLQIDGEVEKVMGVEDLVEKYKAFRWEAIRINGHNISEIDDTFEKAKKIKGKPVAIIADTIKGKGVSFMENVAEWHGKAPNKEQTEKCIQELCKLI
ncbi:MAG: transketolase [Endomicrobiia bacterium]